MEPILPEPVQESGRSPEQNPELLASTPDNAPNIAPERPSVAPTSQSVSAADDAVVIDDNTPSTAATTAPDGSIVADEPLLADDVDVIEKEWVEKAKKIVNATREDPYLQEKEVSKLQADYLQKRYGKQVKVTE